MAAKKTKKSDVDRFETRRHAFASAKSLLEALDAAWDVQALSGYFQHYTTLSRVVSKISQCQWWLTRSTAVQLNDRQEAKKFGDQGLAKKTYQASFVQGSDESAAMWGLYCKNNPFAVRILLPADAIETWLKSIQKEKCVSGTIKSVEFKDVIYAAVPFAQKDLDRLDKRRGNTISWRDVTCNFGRNKEVQSELARQLQDKELTGWIKDREWRHEHESRLCVRFAGTPKKDFLPVVLPPEVIARMSFTFSPWLDRAHEDEAQHTISYALESNAERLKDLKVDVKGRKNPFHRSVLQGALNLAD